MPSRQDPVPFAVHLLMQDAGVSETDYKEYRVKLENALTTAKRRERLTGHIAWVAFAVSFALMFAGGTRIVGSFDPWEKDATALSVILGAIYCVAMIAWPVALAIGFSRFRPKIRKIEDQIRDANLAALHFEVVELRKQVAEISRRESSV